jgi:hypothetical protein
MIGWTNPSALWALALLAGPLIVHLLRRHRAERVPFPSLRFVRPTETAAVRFRLPSDPWLLLLRAGAVGAAVCALAGPVVVSERRLSHWNSLTARAVVIDISDSMREPGLDGTAPTRLAEDAAQAEIRTASYATRIETAELADGLRRAVAWLSTSPPARREIVVLSDFQRGAVSADALRTVPHGVGRRFVSVGRMPESRSIAGVPLLADAATSRRLTISLAPESTSVSVEAPAAAALDGLRVIGIDPGDPSISRALQTASVAGTAAPSKDQPIALRFANAADRPPAVSTLKSGWMLATVLDVMNDRAATSLTPSAGATPAAANMPWVVVLRRPDGRPVVSAADSNGELVFDIADQSDTLFAAAITRAVLNARRGAGAYDEREIATTTDQVMSWRIAPGSVGSGAWRNVSRTDARWFWLLALLMLAVEQWVRARARRRHVSEANRVAA